MSCSIYYRIIQDIPIYYSRVYLLQYSIHRIIQVYTVYTLIPYTSPSLIRKEILIEKRIRGKDVKEGRILNIFSEGHILH